MLNRHHRSWAAATLLALAACTTTPTHEQSAMVIGGVLGGLLGHEVGSGSGRTAATIIGTLAGVAIGGAIGRNMDDNDRRKTAQALESVRTGVPTRWVNPDTRHEYRVVPTRTYDGAGGPCREYTVDARIGGRDEQVFGKACRQSDGSWRAVD